MTVFDAFKTLNAYELSGWLEEYCTCDNAPWFEWWDNIYCKNCEDVVIKDEESGWEMNYGWCELNHKCKYFQDTENIPDVRETILMWLESEC